MKEERQRDREEKATGRKDASEKKEKRGKWKNELGKKIKLCSEAAVKKNVHGLQGRFQPDTLFVMVIVSLRQQYWRCTVGQNDQEYRLQYWATRSSVRSFARTAHSFTCSALCSALTRSLTHSLRSIPSLWDSE